MFEIGGVIIFGVIAQWVAWRLKVPAILPLILFGLMLGPFAEYFLGYNIIQPVYDEQTNHGLYPGNTLFYFVSLSIGLILFEGGLTLHLKEFQGVENAILRLITLGSLVTFTGATLAAYFIVGVPLKISLLFGSLIIVTGPTVIAPILRNAHLNRNVATVLKWEGILIDPIGAFIAVLVFSFIANTEGSAQVNIEVILNFIRSVLIGFSLGMGLGYLLYFLIKKLFIPHYLLNAVTIALVLGAFIFSDIIAHESGLLTVVIMGMTLANLDVPHFKDILFFKENITTLLISILFILLSANMTMTQLQMMFTPEALALFLIVILVLRPISVFWSTHKSGLSLNEKYLLSWVSPRGIVAAGVASLFGIELVSMGEPGAEMITPLVFMIVLGTVLLNATTAGFVAKKLGVTQTVSEGIIIVGANRVARKVGQFLMDKGRHVVLHDSSKSNIAEAKKIGLETIAGDIYDDTLDEHLEVTDVGYLLAMTGNDEVNDYACSRFRTTLGENGTYRLPSYDEVEDQNFSKQTVFWHNANYQNLYDIVQDKGQIHEVEMKTSSMFHKLIKELDGQVGIPLFIQRTNGKFDVILPKSEENKMEDMEKLIYLGQAVSIEETETIESQSVKPKL